MSLSRKIEIGAILTLAGAVITFAFWLGGLSRDVSDLKGDKAIKQEQNEALKTLRDANGAVPIGTIIWVADNWSDEDAQKHGFLIANGRSVPIKDYQALHDAIGDMYGIVSEEGKFKLPDLRGLFIRGYDPDGIRDPDGKTRRLGSFQTDAVGPHHHESFALTYVDRFDANENTPGKYIHKGLDPTTQNTTTNQSIETRPQNMVLLPLIKY